MSRDDNHRDNKKYEHKHYDPFRIFEEIQDDIIEIDQKLDEGLVYKVEKIVKNGINNYIQNSGSREADVSRSSSSSTVDNLYYEIEYESSPIPGAGKFVLKSQKIEPPVRDEVRDVFDQMRDIARQMRSYTINNSRFYDKRVQHENARIFYEQGMFMKDFEDHYAKKVTCSAYYPRYQMMGYDQLRTYFTWRTEVRGGYVEKISTSYAFMYIYELLNNIGVNNPQDGLEKLLFFWKEFREHDHTVDKYVLKWLKDYHIYYELPHGFWEFAEENGLAEYYPGESDETDEFERYCSLSKYDIRDSKFYPEKEEVIRKCFIFTMKKVESALEEKGLHLDDFLFMPVNGMPAWEPFSGALFHPWLKQRDRRIEFSRKEIYVCSENRWFVQQELTTESGKAFLGYCMKQMEAVLRELTKYKYRITAGIGMVKPVVTDKLSTAGIDLEKVVTDAVKDYYRETNKIVVKVNADLLAAIRREAYETQEKLIVPEEDSGMADFRIWRESEEESGKGTLSVGQEPAEVSDVSKKSTAVTDGMSENLMSGQMGISPETTDGVMGQGKVSAESTTETDMSVKDMIGKSTAETDVSAKYVTEPAEENISGPWAELRKALSQTELQAVSVLVRDAAQIRRFADEQGIMLEVLMDGINEKAMDFVGDSLFDDEFMIYDDYIDDVKEMVK